MGKLEVLYKGREQGLEKRRKKNVLVMAKNMKSAQIAVEIIQQVTGLSSEKINTL